jgi:diacylglycerol kinase (ATP)
VTERGEGPIRIIWNANAGSKAGLPTNRSSEEQLRDLMRRHGLGDELVATESEEASVAATRDAVAHGYAVVAAAGGDGTAGLIAFELLGSKTALGILPLGSAMNVARSLAIPRDLESAAEVLAARHVRSIDVAEANGVPFLEVGSIGLNAAIFAEAQRFGKGEYSSFFGLIRVLARYRPARMRIELDSGTISTRALMVAVANGPYTGAGLTFAPDARLDDGMFDVRVFEDFSKRELVTHLWSIMAGRHAYSPKIRTYRSKQVRVDARHPRPCRVDARDLGTTPVEFRVRRQALRVVAPAPDRPDSEARGA